MKIILLSVITAISMLPSVGMTDSRIAMTYPVSISTVIDLAINYPSASFVVDYPGLGDNSVCSIGLKVRDYRFVTSEDIAQALQVKEEFENVLIPIKIADSKTAVINLRLGTYVTLFTISSRDGRTLQATLEDLGLSQGDLLLYGRLCPVKR